MNRVSLTATENLGSVSWTYTVTVENEDVEWATQTARAELDRLWARHRDDVGVVELEGQVR